MDNQHRKITGYRELSQEEVDLMNRIKEQGVELQNLHDELNQLASIDKRWLAIGVTDLQKGIMSLVRSVAKPTTF